MMTYSEQNFDWESLDIQSVYEYLLNNGWQEERKPNSLATILSIIENNTKYSILLPLDKEIADFASRMYDVFRTLEVVEKRPTPEILEYFKNPHQIALEKNCEILSIRFQYIYDEHRQQFSVKHMGNVLTSLQDLFNALGQSESSQNISRGKIKKEILEKTEISIFDTFKGSFGVKLALAPKIEQLELIEKPLGEKVVDKFLKLTKLSDKSDKERLQNLLLQLDRRTASTYRKFLLNLMTSESNLSIEWGSVNPQAGGKANLSYSQTISTIECINKMEAEAPEEYNIEGELLSASKIKNTVLIKDIKEKKKYYIQLPSNIWHDPNIDLTIGNFYSVTFLEIISINPATSEEKIERTVTHLSRLVN